MSNTETEKSYSWLSTGRFTPINSSWLAENLKEVDQSVQDLLTMIEDGDYSLGDADLVRLKRSDMFDHIKHIYHKHQTLAEQYDQILSSNYHSLVTTDVHANDIALTTPHQECHNQFDNASLPSNVSDVSSKLVSTFSLSGSDSESDSVDSSFDKYETPMMPYPRTNGSRSDEYSSVLNRITKYKEELKATQHKLQLSEEEVIELKANADTASTELETEKRRVAELRHKVEVLACQITECNHHIFGLATDLRRSRKELEKMKDELSNAREGFELEKSNLEAEARELSDVLFSAEETNQAMEIEAAYLRNEAREAKAEKSELVRSHKSAEEEVKIKMEALSVEVGEKRRMIGSLEKNLKTQAESSKEKEKRIGELEEKVKETMDGAERSRKGVEELKREVNEKRAEILERGEEKREAIRQLCFSLDYYRNRNQKLREVLLLVVANSKSTGVFL